MVGNSTKTISWLAVNSEQVIVFREMDILEILYNIIEQMSASYILYGRIYEGNCSEIKLTK